MKYLAERIKTYELFSDLFTPPNKLDEDLTQEKIDLLIDLVGSICDDDNLQNKIILPEQEQHILNYTRLFFGPFRVLTPPYGSYYIEEQKQINQDSTVDVKRIYQKFDLGMSEDFLDLPDHIVPELDFMQFLLFNQLKKNESEYNYDTIIEYETLFFTKYFYTFARKFGEAIIESTNVEFFKEISKLLIAFINNERVRIESRDVA